MTRFFNPPGDDPDLTFEDLVAAAVIRLESKPQPKALRRDAPAGQQRLDSLYKEPENWKVSRNVTLIHQADNIATLVGTFLEYRHVSIGSARKLLASAPDETLPTAIEYVSDPWYIARVQRPLPIPTRNMQFGIDHPWELEGGLKAGTCSLAVSAVRGEGIARAELSAPTRFASENGRTILYLPPGLDVLEGLTRECKLRIKAEFDRLS